MVSQIFREIDKKKIDRDITTAQLCEAVGMKRGTYYSKRRTGFLTVDEVGLFAKALNCSTTDLLTDEVIEGVA
ncbi:MAG: helix-turn-helix domain-containing protein [Micrococcaceae bacterium]